MQTSKRLSTTGSQVSRRPLAWEVNSLTFIGKFKGFEKLVTARIALDDVVEKGFEELVNNKDVHVKILVTPKKELLSAA
jgi:(R,R)-butanediol dehydrogenase/meso-butanediol dehydrogenase/diacetyl reductase